MFDLLKGVLRDLSKALESIKYDLKLKTKRSFLQIALTKKSDTFLPLHLKVQSCKLYNNKHMFAPTQVASTQILAFMVVLVYKQTIETDKGRPIFKKLANFWGNVLQNYK